MTTNYNSTTMDTAASTSTVPSKVITIGIAGGTGAGKSTLAGKLFDALGGNTNVSYLVHDSYYKNLKCNNNGDKPNFDDPESLETSMLIEHIRQLKQGHDVQVPCYDFTTHSRKSIHCSTTVPSRPIIIVEGILIFCQSDLIKEMDIKVYVDADADIRLSRRLKRDIQERGRTMEDVLQQYAATVRPMHDLYVEPSKKEADIIVHSTKHSLDTALELLITYLKVKSGI